MPRVWTWPSIQKQEELIGVNVNTVSTPGYDLLPVVGGSTGWWQSFVPLNIKCN